MWLLVEQQLLYKHKITASMKYEKSIDISEIVGGNETLKQLVLHVCVSIKDISIYVSKSSTLLDRKLVVSPSRQHFLVSIKPLMNQFSLIMYQVRLFSMPVFPKRFVLRPGLQLRIVFIIY